MGDALPDRHCGDCHACCVVFEIRELAKPAGTPCRNLDASGCAIYEERPPSCRAWLCGWRMMPNLPEGWRPDLCGILVYPMTHDMPGYNRDALIVSLSRGMSHLSDEDLMGFIALAITNRQPLYLGWHRPKGIPGVFLNSLLEPHLAARNHAGFIGVLRDAVEQMAALEA